MNNDKIVNEIQTRVSKLITEILDKHGTEASLCIPAVLLKTTLQIYQHTLETDEDVRSIITASLDSLKDLPPLIPKVTLH